MYSAVIFALLVAVAAGEKYTTKYDNVDLDDIIKNDRLFNSYINCLLDKGKCSPDGLELKSHISDALADECSKCSEKQRVGAEKVLKHLYEKKQEVFKQLEAKYDADGKYRLKYKEKAAQQGVKI